MSHQRPHCRSLRRMGLPVGSSDRGVRHATSVARAAGRPGPSSTLGRASGSVKNVSSPSGRRRRCCTDPLRNKKRPAGGAGFKGDGREGWAWGGCPSPCKRGKASEVPPPVTFLNRFRERACRTKAPPCLAGPRARPDAARCPKLVLAPEAFAADDDEAGNDDERGADENLHAGNVAPDQVAEYEGPDE